MAALDAASLIAVPTVLALLCAIALAPAVRWLERTGAPASLCAAVVVGGPLVGTAINVYAFAPSAEALSKRGPEFLREAEWRARRIITGETWQVMLLSTAPGSVTEMALTAKILEDGLAVVTAFHVVRIFIILPLSSSIISVTARLAKRAGLRTGK